MAGGHTKPAGGKALVEVLLTGVVVVDGDVEVVSGLDVVVVAGSVVDGAPVPVVQAATTTKTPTTAIAFCMQPQRWQNDARSVLLVSAIR
jgi:hypothetical protein